MFSLMDDDNNFNIEEIYLKAKDVMEDAPYKFDTPLGCLTMTPADVEKLYLTIKGA